MKVLKSLAYTALVATTVFSLNNCGSSAATTTTATPAQAQASSVVSSGLSTSLSNISTSATESQTAAVNLVRGMVRTRALAATETTTESFNETTNCTTSGTLTLAGDFSISVDTVTYLATLDATLTETLDACVESGSFTTADSVTCSYTTETDGVMTCNMSGTFDGSDETSTAEFDFACSTSSQCDGLSITLNGTAHTVGVDIGVTIDSTTTEPALTGTICIDGDLIDIAEVADLETLDSADATCE